jgi:alanine racemase
MISNTESIRVISVFSHLAASEDPSLDSFSHMQVSLFTAIAAGLEQAAGYPFLKHVLNSSGIARFPGYQFDMVRPGIGLYGVGDLQGFNLRVVGRFKTRISQVKTIPGGEPVGYGCSDVSEAERTIAILPVGYADGLNRRLGNGNGTLFIKGCKVPLTGNICMDMCMADITGIDAVEGEEAEIFGENIRVEDLASECGTIPYEILTSVPGRVKRIFFRE